MVKSTFIVCTLLLFVPIFLSCKKKVGDQDHSLTFKTISVSENHLLDNDAKNPSVSIELSMPYPVSYPDSGILHKVQRIMMADFLPDAADTAGQPEEALKTALQRKLLVYESSGKLQMDEDAQTNAASTESAWKDLTKLFIRCNRGGLLSYSVETKQYAGGAHGGVQYRNTVIDLKTGEKLEEPDMFNEASLPLINNLLLKKLEVQNKVQTTGELEQIGYFDVTQIGQYKNFYLSDQGMVYTFNEGEIGAYALGTIEVTLSYQDLEGFASVGSPLEKLIP
jgi:hypothetical protein